MVTVPMPEPERVGARAARILMRCGRTPAMTGCAAPR